jgi:hypothetical protein
MLAAHVPDLPSTFRALGFFHPGSGNLKNKDPPLPANKPARVVPHGECERHSVQNLHSSFPEAFQTRTECNSGSQNRQRRIHSPYSASGKAALQGPSHGGI